MIQKMHIILNLMLFNNLFFHTWFGFLFGNPGANYVLARCNNKQLGVRYAGLEHWLGRIPPAGPSLPTLLGPCNA